MLHGKVNRILSPVMSAHRPALAGCALPAPLRVLVRESLAKCAALEGGARRYTPKRCGVASTMRSLAVSGIA